MAGKSNKKTKNSPHVENNPRQSAACSEREAIMSSQFREDMAYWTSEDPRLAGRAWKIVDDVMKSPFAGIGKPEPLKHLGSGVWSRRLNDEHRITYTVSELKIDFLTARYHYK